VVNYYSFDDQLFFWPTTQEHPITGNTKNSTGEKKIVEKFHRKLGTKPIKS
jgi:hypothetical protein